jgi:hypothetical protein
MKSQTFDQIGRSLLNPSRLFGQYAHDSVAAPTNVVRSMVRLWEVITGRLMTDVNPEKGPISFLVLQQVIMEWNPEQHF